MVENGAKADNIHRAVSIVGHALSVLSYPQLCPSNNVGLYITERYPDRENKEQRAQGLPDWHAHVMGPAVIVNQVYRPQQRPISIYTIKYEACG